jgi:hypothetical protein
MGALLMRARKWMELTSASTIRVVSASDSSSPRCLARSSLAVAEAVVGVLAGAAG